MHRGAADWQRSQSLRPFNLLTFTCLRGCFMMIVIFLSLPGLVLGRSFRNLQLLCRRLGYTKVCPFRASPISDLRSSFKTLDTWNVIFVIVESNPLLYVHSVNRRTEGNISAASIGSSTTFEISTSISDVFLVQPCTDRPRFGHRNSSILKQGPT